MDQRQQPNRQQHYSYEEPQHQRPPPQPYPYPNHMGLTLKLIAASLFVIAFVMLSFMALLIMNLDAFVEAFEMMEETVHLLREYTEYRMERGT